MTRMPAIVLLLSFSLMMGCEKESPSEPIPPNGTGWLAVVMDGGLKFLDLESQDWVETTHGLGTAPNDIVVDGPTLYVINSTSCDLQEFKLLDGWTFTRRLDLGLAQNRNPYNAAMTEDGRLLVTNLLDNSVTVVDLFEWQVDTLWEAGLAPEGIVVDGDRAYVINSGYDFQTFSFHPGSVLVYDIPSGERVDSLTVGINAQYAAMLHSPHLAIACTGDYDSNPGEIWVVATDSLEEVERVAVEGYPGRLGVSNDGELYCAAGGWSLDGDSQGVVLRWPSILDNPLPESVSTALGTIDLEPLSGGWFYVAAREGECVQYFEGDSLVQTISLPDHPVALASIIL